MAQLTLNGAWTLYKQGDPTPIPATVPGCVHTDLLANEILELPPEAREEPSVLDYPSHAWASDRSLPLAKQATLHAGALPASDLP